jgi:uncharacterized protein involved in exopolysaccharide biosynthesis
MEEGTKKQTKLSDYLNILYKWKKLLFINMFFIIVLATVYSYLIPEKFKATSIVMVSATNQQGLGGLGSLLSGDFASLSSQLLGGSNPSLDLVFGILSSRTSLSNVINKFDLMEYYGIDDNNMDKTLKAFVKDVIFEPTDNGLIEVSVINEDPKVSAKIANYFVKLADSMYIELNIEQARNNRIFVEKRYKKNITDLRIAEDSLYFFQRKYGIVAVPEQIEISVKAAAELEAMYTQKQLTAELYKIEYGEDSPIYSSALSQAETIKKRINELKNKRDLSYPTNILYPFSKLPDLAINYFRAYREVEIQTKIMEFVLPLFEQAKVDEQKSIPTLIVIDKAVPPQWKDSPKKAFIILAAVFLGLFFHIVFLFRAEYSIEIPIKRNLVEEKEAKFFNWVKRFYRIRL